MKTKKSFLSFFFSAPPPFARSLARSLSQSHFCSRFLKKISAFLLLFRIFLLVDPLGHGGGVLGQALGEPQRDLALGGLDGVGAVDDVAADAVIFCEFSIFRVFFFRVSEEPRLLPFSCAFSGSFRNKNAILYNNYSYSLDAEVPADGPGLRRERVGRADQLAARRDDSLALPDHGDDGGAGFVFGFFVFLADLQGFFRGFLFSRCVRKKGERIRDETGVEVEKVLQPPPASTRNRRRSERRQRRVSRRQSREKKNYHSLLAPVALVSI